MKIDIERLEIANIQPGDALIITLGDAFDKKNALSLCENLRRAFPDCKVILLEKSCKIKIVRGI